MVEKGTKKIGILGVAPTDLHRKSNPGNDVVLEDTLISLRKHINEITTKEPDVSIIVILSSAQRTINDKIAKQVTGVDVIIGNTMSGADTVVVNNLVTGEKVVIASVEKYGKAINRIDVTFGDNGVVESVDSNALVPLDVSMSKLGSYDDFTLKMSIDEYKQIQVAMERVLGSLERSFPGNRGDPNVSPCFDVKTVQNGERCANGNILIGNACCDDYGGASECSNTCAPLFNDRDDTWSWMQPPSINGSVVCCPIRTWSPKCCAQQSYWDMKGIRHSDAGIGHIMTNAMLYDCKDCKVAFTNAGGIRDGLPRGNVTYGDIKKAFPYDNTISTAKISGKKLVEIVAHALEGYDPSDGAESFFITGVCV